MSGLAVWFSAFRDLHERSRRGQLGARDLALYRAGRDELARTLLAAQKLTLRPGEMARQALRVRRALQVDLDLVTTTARATTVDVSAGGFSTVVEKAPPVGEEISYRLRIPAGETVAGKARIVDAKAQAGNVRLACQFLNLAPDEREALEMFVFDTVLAALSG